jgi:hypothetical protein
MTIKITLYCPDSPKCKDKEKCQKNVQKAKLFLQKLRE